MLREISLLLVEDDQSIREALAELLRGEGYLVQTASCCQDAIVSCKENHFDLVLLDLNLGEEDGWVVFEFLKGQRHDLPIVIISGHSSRFESNPLGSATAVLEKPLDVPVFLNVLREATEPPTRGPLQKVACAMGLALLVAGLSVPF